MRSLWLGRSVRRGRWLRLLFSLLWFAPAVFLWRLALRLVPYQPPTRTLGLVVAGISTLLTLWALWRTVSAVIDFGLRGLLLLAALAFIGATVWRATNTSPDHPLPAVVARSATETAQAMVGWPARTARDVAEYVDSFAFALSGRRRPPRLPDGFPTPDPSATPVRVVVPAEP